MSKTLDPPSQSLDSRPSPNRHSVWAFLLLILLACIAMRAYCWHLNQMLYSHKAPFYDSMSYYRSLFGVLNVADTDGWWACVCASFKLRSTSIFQFITAAILSPVLDNDRSASINIQSGLLFLFLASVYVYLIRVQKFSYHIACLGALLFLTARSLLVTNGGLSDFRMDLSLCLAFGITACWYLMAIESCKITDFLILGIAAAVTCLCRAIAPVYLLFALGPLLIVDLIPTATRRQRLLGVVISVVTVIVLAGWFYFTQFEYLKYYYLIWNTDANAKLPFARALQHFDLAFQCMGTATLVWSTLVVIVLVVVALKQADFKNWIYRIFRERHYCYRLGWIGLAPPMLLFLRQAGLNGLVAMPALFGFILFLNVPVLKQLDRVGNRKVISVVWFVLLAVILGLGMRGWKRHAPDADRLNTTEVNRQILECIANDGQQQGLTEASFAVMHMSDMNTDSLMTTLLFDCNADPVTQERVVLNSVLMTPARLFCLPAVADWARTPGSTDKEKIDGLSEEAVAVCDYLVVPDETTAVELGKFLPFNVINQHLTSVREELLSKQNWRLVKGKIQTSDPVQMGFTSSTGYARALKKAEFVGIYARVR